MQQESLKVKAEVNLKVEADGMQNAPACRQAWIAESRIKKANILN